MKFCLMIGNWYPLYAKESEDERGNDYEYSYEHLHGLVA